MLSGGCIGFFPGTVLPFLGRDAERQGGSGERRLQWAVEVGRRVCWWWWWWGCRASSCFPMDHFINILGQKFEGPLQTN